MNERIKELAKQAGWSGFEALDERNVKFAELIVKECACVADDMKSLDVSEEIKKHFGVEQ